MAATIAWRYTNANGANHVALNQERYVDGKVHDLEPPTPHSVLKMNARDKGNMEDLDGTLSNVAQCIEKLRQNSSTTLEKENHLKQLLELIQTREKVLGAVGSHSQAVPILVSLLRSGSLGVKMLAASVLGSLCTEEELRMKVLLGGCIPPLLALLKSNLAEGQMAAAKTIYAVSQGGTRDHVGSKIFSTEGVVPVLWEQLKNGENTGDVIDALLTGALKNLSKNKEGFLSSTTESGGVDILIKLLVDGQGSGVANVCYLLGYIMMEDSSVCLKVISSDTAKQLLKLLGPGNEASVRAEAAGTLKSLSAQCKEARHEIASSNGIPALINATIAPSKEFMQGEAAQALQENAMCALANISGGLSFVIASLGESLESCTSSAQIADTIGALASALMIYDSNAESVRASDPFAIEKILLKQFKSTVPFLIQERTIEALASLYGNAILSVVLNDSNAKHLLVGLITMAAGEAQMELIRCLVKLCNKEGSLWHAMQGRQGVQLLISLLGLSSEQQQEWAVSLLCILSDENNESKWAITAAGGIPPLVQILETGSPKAKEDSAMILGNLCNHSEDIRACVQTADAVPALLWLLKNGSKKGKEIAARTLNQLIHKSDTGTISQLSALLTSEQPESKVHVLDALRSLLSVSPISDILHEGSAANDAMQTMIRILSSAKAETQAKSASVLAELFHFRQDLRESHLSVNALLSAMKLLNVETENILAEACRCLASIFLSIRQNREVALAAIDAFPRLVLLSSSSDLEVAEQATNALSNILLDNEISAQASPEKIIFAVTRVLRDGTIDGRTCAAAAVARLVQCHSSDQTLLDCIIRCGTVLALAGLLESSKIDSCAASEALHTLALLSDVSDASNYVKPPWSVLVENPHTIIPLVSCAADGAVILQDKSIEVLSRLCRDQTGILGSVVSKKSGCVASIARRLIGSSYLKVKVGGAALLICAAKENSQEVMYSLNESSLCTNLIQVLVGMLQMASLYSSHGDIDICIYRYHKELHKDAENRSTTTIIYSNIVPVWLLCLLAFHDKKSKAIIMEFGALELLADKISQYYLASQSDSREDNIAWVCALLLALLFQDRDIVRSYTTMHSIPVLANLLKSDEMANRYLASQALASLVCNGSRGTLLAVANSGAAGGLISLLGCADIDLSDLLELAGEFFLARNPQQIALEKLFRVDDVRAGSTSRKAIPALVDLLKPMPDRPGAPFLALGLLNQLAADCPPNRLAMVESGALEALTKYLSLGPQDATEEAATDLLGILFNSAEIRKHESAFGAVNQLVAVLRLGGRNSRYSAAKALENLFSSDHIRNGESARQAVQPLVEILNTGLEREQHASIAALVRLLGDNPSRGLAVGDAEMNAVDVLCRILSSNCSVELKGNAAELCGVLFENTRIRSIMAAARCIEPLMALLFNEFSPAQFSAVCALEKLLDDDQLAEEIASHGAVIPFVGLLFGQNYMLHEMVSRALLKLGRDRPSYKMEMVKAGIIESILNIFEEAPEFVCVAFAELLRILTNNAEIAKGSSAAKVVVPLFSLLLRSDIGANGQHSVLQVLVNILEQPQCQADFCLSPHQSVEPVIFLLESPALPVQQLAAELLSHLLLDEMLQKDPITEQAVGPLVLILGSGVHALQQRAIKALANISLVWPNAIAKEGGVYELSKVILQVDPPLPQTLWESAASVLSSILQYSSEYFLEIPVTVLVQLLRSGTESTVIGALNALLVLEIDDSTSAEAMVESGAVEALLKLLLNHHCEETVARLLEALLNNMKIRETKAAKASISSLSMYLLDPQTQSHQGRFMVVLALGALFQNEALAQTADAVSACRALVNLIEEQPTEEMKMVSICALQNLVTHSRANKRAVAEAGGVQVILDLISLGDPGPSVQAAMLIKLLFSTHTIQEYASSQSVKSITAAIEKDLWSRGAVNDEYLKALHSLLGNFPRLRASDSATLSIPHLIMSLKTGSEAIQEVVLDLLLLFKQTWTSCPVEVFKAQSVAASEAISFLQYLLQTSPTRFQEKVEQLLLCFPGSLIVIIKCGRNLRQSVGNPSVYCKLTLGSYPPLQTKIVSTGPTPEWDESFMWAFDTPPKGLKLHISCKNKSKIGKNSFGKVSIQIDRVITLGSVAGEYTLLPVSKSGPPRSIEIEFRWSNK